MGRQIPGISLALLLLGPVAAMAQGEVHYTVATGSGGLVFTEAGGGNAIYAAPGLPLVVRIACQAPVSCDSIQVRLLWADGSIAANRQPPFGPTAGLWQITPDLFAVRNDLKLRIASGKHVLPDVAIRPLATVSAPASTSGPKVREDVPSTDQGSVNRLVATDCGSTIESNRKALEGHTYDRAGNRAFFLVTPGGNVVLRPGRVIDEDDEVDVLVVADSQLMHLLKVRRSSAFRTPGALNLVGGSSQVPTFESAEVTPACGVYVAALSDFQPGRGEVTISAMADKGDVTTGTFEFSVNTLYSAAFSLGVIRSQLRNPVYGLVVSGADSVVSIVEDDKPRLLYTLTYTHFLWGKRDLEKEAAPISLQRLNPMLGLVLSDVKNNFVAGASYDLLSSLYLTAGVHLGRVRVLNPDGGVRLGGRFTGASTQIPVVKHWDHDFFLGLSLDLRAATQFFQKAMGTAAGGSN